MKDIHFWPCPALRPAWAQRGQGVCVWGPNRACHRSQESFIKTVVSSLYGIDSLICNEQTSETMFGKTTVRWVSKSYFWKSVEGKLEGCSRLDWEIVFMVCPWSSYDFVSGDSLDQGKVQRQVGRPRSARDFAGRSTDLRAPKCTLLVGCLLDQFCRWGIITIITWYIRVSDVAMSWDYLLTGH